MKYLIEVFQLIYQSHHITPSHTHAHTHTQTHSQGTWDSYRIYLAPVVLNSAVIVSLNTETPSQMSRKQGSMSWYPSSAPHPCKCPTLDPSITFIPKMFALTLTFISVHSKQSYIIFLLKLRKAKYNLPDWKSLIPVIREYCQIIINTSAAQCGWCGHWFIFQS